MQELSLEDWDRVMALNLRAPFALTRDLVPCMPGGGLVVNISDVGANRLWTGYPAYVISKAALETLTRLQARAYAPGVRVNALALGLVLPPDGMPEGTWRSLVSRSPAGRPVTAEEIGAGIDLLLDRTALNGRTIVLDGGNPPSGVE
jgi:NAD(P)-dependent dehydrogenase (short-subunit alcohol dehydrogenase family)